MSQFSAKGLAEHRWDQKKILAHFYQGTTIGRIEDMAGQVK
jgi:peptidoglycan hydrolase-like amidase